MLGTLETVDEVETPEGTQAVKTEDGGASAAHLTDRGGAAQDDAGVEDSAHQCGHPGGSPLTVEPAVSSILGERKCRLAKLFEQLELDSEQLSIEEKNELRTLLEMHAEIFAVEPSELGTTSITQHSINTGDQPPPPPPPPPSNSLSVGCHSPSDLRLISWCKRC